MDNVQQVQVKRRRATSCNPAYDRDMDELTKAQVNSREYAEFRAAQAERRFMHNTALHVKSELKYQPGQAQISREQAAQRARDRFKALGYRKQA